MEPFCCLLYLAAALPAAPAASNSEDEKVLREAKVAAEGPALLDYLRRHTLTAAQREQVRTALPRLGHDEFKVRQEASTALLRMGPAIVPHLRRALDDPDEEVRERLRAALAALEPGTRPGVSAAVVRLVRTRPPAGAVAVLLAYLPEAEDETVEDETVMALAVLGVSDGKVAAAVADALKDADPVLRSAAAVILGRSGTAEQRAAVQALLADPNPLVRFRAAQGLLAARERAALPALAALVSEGPLTTALRADELLACTAGPRAPRLFGTDAAARRRSRAAWETWARLHGAADLARRPVDLPPFHPTLRAAAAARRFVVALLRDEREMARSLSDLPFLVNGEQVMNARGDLEQFLVPFARNLGNQGLDSRVLWTRFVEPAPRKASLAERDFLARFRKERICRIEVVCPDSEPAAPLAPGLRPDGSAFFTLALQVRLGGDRPRVVALHLCSTVLDVGGW
jgi:HEAT repeat protein